MANAGPNDGDQAAYLMGDSQASHQQLVTLRSIMTTIRSSAMSQTEQEIAVRRVEVWVCDLCLSGAGGECHVPGCAFWCHDAPTGDAVGWWQGMRERTPSDKPEPRVWLDGDDVPAGTWVYVLDEDDPEDKVHQLDAYEDCRNGNLGPLVEILLPDEVAAVDRVTAEQIRRGRP